MNLLDVRAEDGVLRVGDHRLRLAMTSDAAPAGGITVGVRPEGWEVVGAGAGIPVRIDLVEELGSDSFAYGTAALGDSTRTVSVRLPHRDHAEVGTTIHVAVPEHGAHLFDTETGRRLNP